MKDELSIFFENPPTDPLGHESVVGKILFTDERVTIRYKLKDRAFRKNESRVISLDYPELEQVGYRSKFFGSGILTIITRQTDKLRDFPGGNVSMVRLHVNRESRDLARKAESFVEYYQSEALLAERDRRLSEAREEI